jgi:hypothetical protein
MPWGIARGDSSVEPAPAGTENIIGRNVRVNVVVCRRRDRIGGTLGSTDGGERGAAQQEHAGLVPPAIDACRAQSPVGGKGANEFGGAADATAGAPAARNRAAKTVMATARQSVAQRVAARTAW